MALLHSSLLFLLLLGSRLPSGNLNSSGVSQEDRGETDGGARGGGGRRRAGCPARTGRPPAWGWRRRVAWAAPSPAWAARSPARVGAGCAGRPLRPGSGCASWARLSPGCGSVGTEVRQGLRRVASGAPFHGCLQGRKFGEGAGGGEGWVGAGRQAGRRGEGCLYGRRRVLLFPPTPQYFPFIKVVILSLLLLFLLLRIQGKV